MSVVTDQLGEARFTDGLTCFHCGDAHVHRWGQTPNNLQRYRCRTCRRTFNERTGTPMARTRLPEKWEAFAELTLEAKSCQKIADALGINKKTAWAWRHKLLSALPKSLPTHLDGIVEADEKYFRRSYKGSRFISRPPRRHGGQTKSDGAIRGTGADKVAALCARSRSGAQWTRVMPDFDKEHLIAEFGPHLDPAAILCTDASSSLCAFVRAVGIPHYALNASRGERVRGIYHIQSINSYHARLEDWLRPFHGVSTKWLANYLNGHVFVELTKGLHRHVARERLLVNTASLPRTTCPTCGSRRLIAT